MGYPKKTIYCINDLLEDLLARDDPKNPIWFRGHANKNWNLVPSIYRNYKRTEIDYIKKFKQKATLLVEPKPNKQYEWLFIMRHHKMPSRLLDWTESPLVGIFFALDDEDEDGVLWSLLPLELNQNAHVLEENDKSLPSFDENKNILNAYDPDHFKKDIKSKRQSLAIIAPRNSNRMQVQLSVFTINHSIEKPIDKIGGGSHIWKKYIIPKNSKKTLKKELSILKITNFQLFPELDYAFDEIRDESYEN